MNIIVSARGLHQPGRLRSLQRSWRAQIPTTRASPHHLPPSSLCTGARMSGSYRYRLTLLQTAPDRYILRNWAKTVSSSDGNERYQLRDVVNAIGRCGFRELVPDL